jgi:hypothetical protein
MKYFYLLLFILTGHHLNSQTTWTGPSITFTKPDNADWNLEANQDRITDKVWITRAENRGIFNAVLESVGGQAGNGPQPSDTEWAFGTIQDGIENLVFSTWGAAHSTTTGGNPPSLIGEDMVVHLITDDIYINIKFLSWSTSGSGGGFSYERSTNQTLSTKHRSWEKSITLINNPISDNLQISGLDEKAYFCIYGIQGRQLKHGTIAPGESIFVENLKSGIYFIQLSRGRVLKFIKK